MEFTEGDATTHPPLSEPLGVPVHSQSKECLEEWSNFKDTKLKVFFRAFLYPHKGIASGPKENRVPVFEASNPTRVQSPEMIDRCLSLTTAVSSLQRKSNEALEECCCCIFVLCSPRGEPLPSPAPPTPPALRRFPQRIAKRCGTQHTHLETHTRPGCLSADGNDDR